MLCCVLDTDVVIAVMRSPTGASSVILQIAVGASQVCLLTSVPFALEYKAKCLEVTFNLRDYGDAPARFGIQAMRPADAIKRIRL